MPKLKKKPWNLKMVKREVRRLDPSLSEDSKEFKTAVILIASTIVGTNTLKLVRWTGYSKTFVYDVARRFRKNKVWVGSTIYHGGWFDNESGGIAFWMDVCVGLGYMERR